MLNVPDTVGYTGPEEIAAHIRMQLERVPNAYQAVISAHCHNDLGLAVANTLAGSKAAPARSMHHQRPR